MTAAGQQPRIRIRLTRLGWQFAFVSAFATAGGAARGYNLPLVLAAIIIAALIVQWRWSRMTIRNLAATRRPIGEVFAGRSFPVSFSVVNTSRFFPAWMLKIDDAIRPLDESAPSFLPWRRGPKPIDASCGLGVIPPGRKMRAQYQCRIDRRGVYDFGPISLSSGMPLGLMIASRRERDFVRERVYVYPELLPLRRHWRERLYSRAGGSSTAARRSGTDEGDFFGIRGWVSGDSPRWIHWRTTARLGEPAVRQFEQQRRFDFCILIDGFKPENKSDEPDEALETVISAAATLVTELVPTPTNKIGLAIAGRRNVALTSGGGCEQLLAMLRHLAEVNGTASPDLEGAITEMVRSAGRPRDLLVLSPRAVGGHAEAMLRVVSHRSSWRWCGLDDGSIDLLVVRH